MYCFIWQHFESQTRKTNFDFGPCSEEDQGELGAEEEEEMDVDSSVDVREATGGILFPICPNLAHWVFIFNI